MKLDWTKIKGTEKFLAALQIIHECHMCGRCCVNMKGIAYNSSDTIRMAKHLGVSRNEFVKEYTRPSSSKPQDRWLNVVGEHNACIFWSEKGCTKYEGRGQVCRLYPWTSPEQLNSAREGKGWHLYPKCKGMQVTFLKVLEASKVMPVETANAILKSSLGSICMLNLIRDTYNDEAATFTAREIGLPNMPEMEQLKSIAWNFAVAFATRFTPQQREAEIAMVRAELAKGETS
jgi:Fe-S-cluster containining protein